MVSWTSSTGDVALPLEARLVLGAIDLRSGNADAAQTRIEALIGDAKSTGFDLIARKAAGLASENRPGSGKLAPADPTH